MEQYITGHQLMMDRVGTHWGNLKRVSEKYICTLTQLNVIHDSWKVGIKFITTRYILNGLISGAIAKIGSEFDLRTQQKIQHTIRLTGKLDL